MAEEKARPSVSIVITAYNTGPYLRRCLGSVAAQTLRDWECVCVDNGSTDGGGAILDEFAARDSRFVVIHIEENCGPSGGRNAGLEAARGEYVGFVDSDDWIEPETYELALEAARRTGADIVQWRWVNETKSGSRPSKEMPEGEFDFAERPDCYSGVVWEKIFRRSFVLENKIRFPIETKIGGEDFFFSDATYACTKKAYSLNRMLYHLDRTRESTSSKRRTADEIRACEHAIKEATAYLERLANRAVGKERKQAFASIIFSQKMYAKGKALNAIPKPDIRLYRSVFPELEWQTTRLFFKFRTKQSLIQLLVVWRLNWVVRALVWAKGKLRRLAGKG